MTALVQLQKQVKRLEQTLAPKPPQDILIRWSFPVDSEKPHGRYGYQDVNYLTREMKAVPEEEEIWLLKQCYEEEVAEHAKRQHDGCSWATFEDFLKSHECTCARCQSRAKGKELTDLLKEREEVFESLTKGMTSEEKAEFEHKVFLETVNSEDFRKLIQDDEGKCQSKDKEVTDSVDDGK